MPLKLNRKSYFRGSTGDLGRGRLKLVQDFRLYGSTFTQIADGGTLNFLALYIGSILESLSFAGPGC